MKKLLIFVLFLTFFGCNSIDKNRQTLNNFNCPLVFFSSEDRVFIDNIDGSTSFDDVSLKAELNNFAFTETCYQQNEIAVIELDLLIITKPMNNLQNPNISMPIYVILLNQNDEILETQYFMLSGSIKKNSQTKAFEETDIIDTLKIITNNLQTKQLVVGFMLEKKKRSFLN